MAREVSDYHRVEQLSQEEAERELEAIVNESYTDCKEWVHEQPVLCEH